MIKEKETGVKYLKLEGHNFTLEFFDVERKVTTRRQNRYHDDREEIPAWEWRGKMKVTHLGSRRVVEADFHTDRFKHEHVAGLGFHEIVMLTLSNRWLHFGTVREGMEPIIIDYLATQALFGKYFGNDLLVHLKPIRIEDRNPLALRQPVYSDFVKIPLKVFP